MENKMSTKSISCSIFILMVFTWGHALARRNIMMKPKGTIKTIKSLQDGDVIHCVDYYQQPAFENPVIKNSRVHPSYYPTGIKMTNSSGPPLKQTWHKYGKCPKGTVPIRRGRNDRIFRKQSRRNNSKTVPNDLKGIHEYATTFQKGIFYGGSARINLWNPSVEVKQEFSQSQIWVEAACDSPDCNTVETGWTVNPAMYGDTTPRFFVFYTNDNYNRTACYNLECGHFVLVPGNIALGTAFENSVVDGLQIDVEFRIHKDEDSNGGHWWVYLDDKPIGYWPRTLFTSLGFSADEVVWGGEIVNTKSTNKHTKTQMGSGEFPSKGYAKASYFRQCSVVDIQHDFVPAEFKGVRMTNKECYDIELGPPGTLFGKYFLYGGPGLNPKCQ